MTDTRNTTRLSQDVRYEVRRVLGELTGPVRLIKRLAEITVTDKESADVALALIDGFLPGQRAFELAELAAKGEFGEIEKERLKAVLSVIRHDLAGALSSNAKKMALIAAEFELEYL